MKSAAIVRRFAHIPIVRVWREAAFLSLWCADMCWIALWYSALSQIGGGVTYGRAFLVLGGIYLLSHYLIRLFDYWQLRSGLRQGLVVVLVLASFYYSVGTLIYLSNWPGVFELIKGMVRGFASSSLIPPEFWVALVVLLLWRRGVRLARQAISSDIVMASFGFGGGMFFLFGVLPYFFMDSAQALRALFAFILCILVALSCARIFELSRTRGAIHARFSREWIVAILLASVALAGAGALATFLLQDTIAPLLSRLALLVLWGLGILLILIATPVILLVLIALPWLSQRLNLQLNPFRIISELLDTLRKLLPSLPDAKISQFFTRVAVGSKPFALWGILAMLLAGMLAITVWRRWYTHRTGQIQQEDLFALGEWLRQARKGLRKRTVDLLTGFVRRLNPGYARRWMTAMRVRLIYAQLMELCARLGKPRPAPFTPLEFLPDAQKLFPEAGRDLQTITYAYLRARYGELPEGGVELDAVLQAWERVRAQGHRLLAALRSRK